MGSLSDLTLGEIARGLARYKPAAVTIAVILVAVMVMPKPAKIEPVDIAGGQSANVGVPAAQATPLATDESTAAISNDSAFPTFESFSPVESSFSSTEDFSFDESSFPSATETFPESDFDFAPTTGSEQPLRVVESTWATRTAGTPLATNGVPSGTLPVGTRAGQDDKLSFVRLSGDESLLRLTEDPAGARAIVGTAAVQACLIKSASWTGGEAIAFDVAPQPDTSKCVQGTRSIEGVWSFNVGSLGDPADDRGFALRPGTGAGADFQVAFKPS